MQKSNQTRPYTVAGSFYTDNKNELSNQIQTLLKDAKKVKKEDIKALIVPHAGYIFSADVSAVAYKTLDKKYKNIFLIGSSHHISFDGASIYNIGDYTTPLGDVKVDTTLASSLIEQSENFVFKEEAHKKEHTLEVQLPFLQTIYKDDLNIIPIIIGTTDSEILDEISKTLKPYFDDEENLFIISTDLSHYPKYDDANKIDIQTLESLTHNSSEIFINRLIKNEDQHIENLQTSACAWGSLLVLLEMTKDENFNYELLAYQNSGDSSYGNKSNVVGYGAVRIYKNSNDFFLTSKEKKQLLEVAKISLYDAIIHEKKADINQDKISEKLKQNLGAFVTLYKDGNLRGCIGTFEPNQPLYSVITDMTISSALNDSRFKQVTKDELKDISIEISVLTPRKEIKSLNEIVLGKHGIYIQKDDKTGTFLPHVATEMNWSVEEFVGYCASEKAMLGYDGYKNAKLFTYEAIVF